MAERQRITASPGARSPRSLPQSPPGESSRPHVSPTPAPTSRADTSHRADTSYRADRSEIADRAQRVERADAADRGPLLDARLLSRLESLQLGTRRRLAGALVGEHRSTRHGSSLDFADQRSYHPGDDYRRIDYHVLARLDQLLVRLYEADEDLHVRLLLDTSASMSFGGKARRAAQAAAALGFVALTRRDTVSAHTFPFERSGPRFVGRGAVGPLFRYLETLEFGGVTSFEAAVQRFLARPGPAGLTVVISDFLTTDWSEALVRLPSRGADFAAVHVVADEDLDPSVRGDLLGDLELLDSETGEAVLVSASDAILSGYRVAAQAWVADVRARCRSIGGAYVLLTPADDLERVLLGGWRQAGVVR